MNDPNTRIGTSTKSGGLTLLKSDGTVIFINPQDGDYGTAFVPKPQPGVDTWRTPLEYFEQNTRAVEPLAPPPPGRFPPLTPGEMAPRPAAPVEPPPPAPKSAPLPKGGEGPTMSGGPGTPIGPLGFRPSRWMRIQCDDAGLSPYLAAIPFHGNEIEAIAPLPAGYSPGG
jgi:hypothetical protein